MTINGSRCNVPENMSCYAVKNFTHTHTHTHTLPLTNTLYHVCSGGLILDDGPGLAVVAVGNLEGGDKLHRAKVLGSLSDDACDPLGRLQVHLRTWIKQLHLLLTCSSHVPHMFLTRSSHVPHMFLTRSSQSSDVPHTFLTRSSHVPHTFLAPFT